MTIKQIHDFLRFLLNKEQGGWQSPEDLDTVIHRAQMWLFGNLVDVYAKTQKIQDSLKVFSVTTTFTTASDGIIQLPVAPASNPYEHFLAGNIDYFDVTASKRLYRPFKLLNDDEIAERRNSQILEPTSTNPIGNQSGVGEITLYPAGVYSGEVRYLRTPQAPVYGYSENGRQLVYSPGTSTQLEWNEGSINKIIVKSAQLLGVNLSDELMIQYTELKDNQNI